MGGPSCYYFGKICTTSLSNEKSARERILLVVVTNPALKRFLEGIFNNTNF